MKILITGSSGYVGFVLSKYFCQKGIPVIGLDVEKNKVWQNNHLFTYYHCDIRDVKKIYKILNDEQPTHIIHLAYLMNPIHDIQKERAIDIGGSINILNVANSIKSVKQLIKLGSTSAYGAWSSNHHPKTRWLFESHPLKPRDYRYGINKKKVEEYYSKYEQTNKKRKNLKIVTLRMCTAIGGSYHKKGGVVSILHSSPFLLKLNNRYCELQFLHEEDLTNLFDLIANDKTIEGIYNLAPDSYSNMLELAPDKMFISLPLRLARAVAGLAWKLRLTSFRPAAMTLSTYGIVASPQKLMDRYNYKFKYSTLDAFRSTIKERKQRGTL